MCKSREIGLCFTCTQVKKCSLSGKSEPVLYCSEYDCQGAACDDNAVGRSQTETTAQNRNEVCAGLCGNCSNKDICMASKKEGGVWFCEEYC
ncbi:MAG: hypothetical protein PHW04_14865 [Candidatus Wallbacteria bacterium]|nr:hypothetical protein [Candidatus Wallbacteria bacterium]